MEFNAIVDCESDSKQEQNGSHQQKANDSRLRNEENDAEYYEVVRDQS
jgi:hypothetical protein